MRELTLEIEDWKIPGDVRTFLRRAHRRLDQFLLRNQINGFVPSDFENVYRVLRHLTQMEIPRGDLFCEWGSGFGIVSCLAAMLGFEVIGIELEERLVNASIQLAEDFDLEVEFVQDSFIPPGTELYLSEDSEWLVDSARVMDEVAGIPSEAFDVVFVFPWPNEEDAVAEVFEASAGEGALLVTHHGDGSIRVREKD